MNNYLTLLMCILLTGCSTTSELHQQFSHENSSELDQLAKRSLGEQATLHLATGATLTPLFFQIREDSLVYWLPTKNAGEMKKQTLGLSNIDSISFKRKRNHLMSGIRIGGGLGLIGWMASTQEGAGDFGGLMSGLNNTMLLPMWLGGGVVTGGLVGASMRTEVVEYMDIDQGGNP